MSKNVLTDEQKHFIIQWVATYRSNKEIIAEFKARFNQDINAQVIEHYDPYKVAGRLLSKKYKMLFLEIREAYNSELASVPIANKRYRLEKLQSSLEKAEEMGRSGNIPLAMQALKQAAEEIGNVYTNKQELNGIIEYMPTDKAPGDMTPEERNVRKQYLESLLESSTNRRANKSRT